MPEPDHLDDFTKKSAVFYRKTASTINMIMDHSGKVIIRLGDFFSLLGRAAVRIGKAAVLVGKFMARIGRSLGRGFVRAGKGVVQVCQTAAKVCLMATGVCQRAGTHAARIGKTASISIGKYGKISFAYIALFCRKSQPAVKVLAPPVFLGIAIIVLLQWTGLGIMINEELGVFLNPVLAFLFFIAICFIPAVSPVLGPGLIIAILAGVLTGEQIAAGMATPVLAITALLAIDAQIGGGFIPHGLALGEHEPETISAGVPGIVFTRLITVPAALLLAYFFSFSSISTTPP
jgi:PTS system glucitol/sorbitol-specific IIC component